MARARTSLRFLLATALLSLLPLSGWWLWRGRGPLGQEAHRSLPSQRQHQKKNAVLHHRQLQRGELFTATVAAGIHLPGI